MTNAEKHKKRSQYRHFDKIPRWKFYLNAERRRQQKEGQQFDKIADGTEDPLQQPEV